MPTIAELFSYEVPAYALPDDKPAKIVPCPYCKGFHLAPPDARYVKVTCTLAAKRPDYADLIDGGPAIRPLLGAFISGKALPDNSELWELQPRELWREVREISGDVAAKLEAVDLK